MKILQRIADALHVLAQVVAGGALGAIAIITLMQIYFRFILNDSLVWSVELGTFLNIWVGFIGAIVVMRNWQHTNIPTFVNMVSTPMRYYIMTAVKLVPLGFVLYLAVKGVDYIQGPLHFTSPAMGFNTRWVKIAVPISGVVMTFFCILIIIEDIIAIRRRDSDHFDNQGNAGIE